MAETEVTVLEWLSFAMALAVILLPGLLASWKKPWPELLLESFVIGSGILLATCLLLTATIGLSLATLGVAEFIVIAVLLARRPELRKYV